MVNFENAKIYKIECNISKLCYIGSTCEKSLLRRLTYHASAYKQYLNNINSTHYISSYVVLLNNDYNIILLEEMKGCTKQELLNKERFYIENTCCVNKNITGRTQKEYYICNKDKIRNYYITNSERIKNRMNKYYSENTAYIKQLKIIRNMTNIIKSLNNTPIISNLTFDINKTI